MNDLFLLSTHFWALASSSFGTNSANGMAYPSPLGYSLMGNIFFSMIYLYTSALSFLETLLIAMLKIEKGT